MPQTAPAWPGQPAARIASARPLIGQTGPGHRGLSRPSDPPGRLPARLSAARLTRPPARPEARRTASKPTPSSRSTHDALYQPHNTSANLRCPAHPARPPARWPAPRPARLAALGRAQAVRAAAEAIPETVVKDAVQTIYAMAPAPSETW